MSHTILCQKCQSDISQKPVFHGTIVCDCGEVNNLGYSTNTQEGYGTSIWLTSIAIFIMVVLFHLVNWDVYSLEIIPLKVKDYSKLADEKDYLRIAQLCEARKKPSCQESALVSAAFFKPKDADLLMRIAKLQLARRAYTNALQLFGTILRIDPKYDKARLELAKLLIASNNKKEAKKHLNYLVFSNNSLETNITAAREFVKLLMDEKDYVTAKNVIEHTRSKGEITALFLEKEYLQITQSQ